jgi:hypothetical protein
MVKNVIDFLRNKDWYEQKLELENLELEDLKKEEKNIVYYVLCQYKNSLSVKELNNFEKTMSSEEIDDLKNTVLNFDFLWEVKKNN